MPVPQAESHKVQETLAHVNTVKNLGLNLSLAAFSLKAEVMRNSTEILDT